MTLISLMPALPEIFLVLVILSLLLFGVLQKANSEEQNVKISNMTTWLVTLSLCLLIFMEAYTQNTQITAFGNMFINDKFAIFCKVLVLLGSLAILIISSGFLKRHGMARFEFPLLILFSVLGMMMMISANDLIAMYIGLEMQSLPLYILTAFRRDDGRSVEAGLKYFILGALASGLLLYGSSLIFGFSGTTNFQELAKFYQSIQAEEVSLGVILGLVFILAGLSFKVSAVPFHMWAPDVYEGATTPVTAFFSIAPKIAALALIIRIMFIPFGELILEWQQIIIFISVASMLLGSIAAINQKNIKRLMAYSSISHVGFALIGIAAGNELGVQAVLVYLAIYLVMNIGAFSCILCMRKEDQMYENISDLAGFGNSHPMFAFSFAVFLFSLAGIPPLAGFAGKFGIFFAAINAELYYLAIIGVIASVISAFYYLRIVKVIYFENGDDSFEHTIDKGLGVVTTVSTLIIILLLFYPDFIFHKAGIAATALLIGP